MKRLLHDRRGAITLEYLIALLPMLFFFASVWQLADLYAAQLVVQRAASAAGRAASVVLPDDPFYYGDEAADSFAGKRREQIVVAAKLVLAASGRVLDPPEVSVDGTDGHGPLTARVSARFRCFAGWGALVCGADGERVLTASARYPYHRASYTYP